MISCLMAMDNPIPKDFSKDGIKQPIQDWPSDEVLNVAILTHKKKRKLPYTDVNHGTSRVKETVSDSQ